ncbi:MAG: hypothetical protein AAF242_12910 [Bacteroidota bacterium]
MRKDTDIYELLVRSLDATLDPQDQKVLDDALKSNPDWEEKRRQLLAMRSVLGQFQATEQPDFTDQVMTKVAKVQARVMQLPQLVVQIAAACVILVLSVLMSLYLSEGSLNTDVLLGIQDLSPDDAYTLLNY